MLSIWETRHFHRPVDLAVVGGGIVGLFTALFHKRARPVDHVVVLERGGFPAGASVKNAGFACFGSPSEILADMDAEGADAALGRVEERWKGLRELRAELGDAAIGYAGCGAHELFPHGDALYARTAERLDALNQVLRPIFGTTVFSWRNDLIGAMGLRTGHLAWAGLEGTVDSGRLVLALLHKARSAGVEVRTGTEVRAIEENAARAALDTDHGRLEAAQVLVATNGFVRQLLPQADVMPARGQVVLTTPVPGLRLHGIFHLDEGYYYFRHLGDRVLLGGGRQLDKAAETTWEDATTPLVQHALENLLKETILPGVPFTIAQRWTGVMGFRTRSKSPWVERLTDRTAVAAGLGGIGVAIGIRTGRRAAALTTGRP
ncbi:MAG: FAD-dependent oxidoreductase [Flavobacteriales bacterium]|jgi:glycine/D-amino acid oxidase-like deaminating enzyme|nr:FAD-dependent oxidoreductase [Flavobacteriales bacterium]